MFSVPRSLRLVVLRALFTGAMLLALQLGLSSPTVAHAQAGPPPPGTAPQAAAWRSSHGLAPQPPTAYRAGSAVMQPGSALPAQGGPSRQGQSPSDTPHARANVFYGNVDGWFGASATVQFTVTTSDGTWKGGGQGTAGPDGWLNGVGCNCDMLPGDHVHVTSSAGFDAVLVPITIGGQIDVVNDLVSGQMSGGTFPGTGNVSVYSDSRQQGSGQDISIAGDGKYNANFLGQFDIMAGDKVDVWYNDANGNQVGTELFTLRIDVNYANDWVQAQTNPYAQVTVTVVGKGTVTGFADFRGQYMTPGWQGSTGWVNDIAPGDVISVTGGSYSTEVNPIGTITGRAILGQDVVGGNVYAPWFTVPLHGLCEVWVNNGPPWVEMTVQPDGGSYRCDFSTVGWHIAAGQDIAVRYYQPDGNSVINVFKAYENDVFLPLVRRSH